VLPEAPLYLVHTRCTKSIYLHTNLLWCLLATLDHLPGIKGIDSNTYDEAPPKGTKPKTSPPIKPYVPPEAQIIAVPFTDIEVPMPTTTIMTTAATTAFISVAATLIGQSLFKYLVII
jgi:hypothetical protein